MSNNYNANTIQTLSYFEHIRKYPGMYIGSKDENGLLHCAKEIISNSIDEYLNGAGDKIEVKILKDGGLYIKDNGRGIPHGKHESGCSVLQACFSIANTGGKFNNATGETGYNTSGGEHGTGGKAVNALSKKMIVTTSNNGLKEIVEFSKGQFISYKTEKTEDTGVSVLFYPDETVLEKINFNSKKIQTMLQEFSFLCSGLTFSFIDEILNINTTYYSENGLYDYLNKDGELIVEPWFFSIKEGDFQLEVIIGYNHGYGNSYKLYTNNIPQEKGTHLTGFRTALTQSLNNYAREHKLLKEKEENLSGSDFLEGQLMILNFKMIDPVFKGQNKEELSSSEGRTYVQKFTTAGLEEIFNKYPKNINIIITKALKARRAREAAKKARDTARNKVDKKKAKLLSLPSKLVDANSKNREECELFVVEGDSAAGGMISARDPHTQAVFPIRGKLINLYKNSSEKVFANQEVINLIKAIGLDFDPKTKKMIYDKDKLRYGKIMPACDGDPDGQAIKNLLLTFFWSLCPELILNGHIWVPIPPLFRITKGNNTYVYLKNAAELEEYKIKHKNEKFLVNRNKGLGEQDSSELGECLLEPETRNIVQIVVNNKKEASDLFEILMGNSVPPRREWLLAHSEEASDNIW